MSAKLTIAGEIKQAEEHLINALVLLDMAAKDFKSTQEKEYINQIRSRLAMAKAYCFNVVTAGGRL